METAFSTLAARVVERRPLVSAIEIPHARVPISRLSWRPCRARRTIPGASPPTRRDRSNSSSSPTGSRSSNLTGSRSRANGPPGYAQQPPGGFGVNPYQMPAMQHQGPVASVGLFGHIPCPHCNMPHAVERGRRRAAARFAGGLVGWLIASAFLTKYYCLNHGEIPTERFPLPHQSAITSRKIMKVGRRRGVPPLLRAVRARRPLVRSLAVRTAIRSGLVLSALAAACGTPAPAPNAAAAASPAAEAPLKLAEWKGLCEAQAERARKCPGPAPEPASICTERAACFGALVRADVIRSLAKCQSQNDCTRPCTIDRVTATLPPTPTSTALEDACISRRALCPSLDCNAVVRPVRSLDADASTPLIECMKFEKSCLDVAACVLEKMSPVIAKLNACDDAGRDDH